MHLTLASDADVIAQDLSRRHVLRLHGSCQIVRPYVLHNMAALLNLDLLIDLCLARFHLICVVYGHYALLALLKLRLLNILVHEALHS